MGEKAATANAVTKSESDGSKPAAEGQPGVYGLLATMLATLEAALGWWFAKAEGGVERSIAGGMMTLVLFAFLAAVVLIEYRRTPAPSTDLIRDAAKLDKPGLPQADIVAKTGDDDKQLTDDNIRGPDGTYLIARPPPNWTIAQHTMQEVFRRAVQVKDVSDFGTLDGSLLEMQFGEAVTIEPCAGKTLLDGRPYRLLLSEELRRAVRIITVPRRAPPLFVERSLAHNVIMILWPLMGAGLISLDNITPGVLPKTNREILVARATQNFTDILVDGRLVDHFRNDIRLTGVRGELVDYIILVCNLRLNQGQDSVADAMDADVDGIFRSMIFASAPNKQAEEHDDIARSNQKYDAYMTENGVSLFENAWTIALARLREMPMKSHDDITKALSILRPFRAFAATLPNMERDLSELWAAMGEAENGNTAPLRDLLKAAFAPAPAETVSAPAAEEPQPAMAQLTSANHATPT